MPFTNVVVVFELPHLYFLLSHPSAEKNFSCYIPHGLQLLNVPFMNSGPISLIEYYTFYYTVVISSNNEKTGLNFVFSWKWNNEMASWNFLFKKLVYYIAFIFFWSDLICLDPGWSCIWEHDKFWEFFQTISPK